MSTPEKRRFVTIVYEIKDDAAWQSSGNPLNYEHNGLRSVCVSAGDLASFMEEVDEVVQDGQRLTVERYDELHKKHVMSSFANR